MSEVKVDTISERTAAGGVTIDGVLVKDGTATFQTAAGSPLVFEGATADAYETTFAITDPTADRTITFPDSSFTVPTTGGIILQIVYSSFTDEVSTTSGSYVDTGLTATITPVSASNKVLVLCDTMTANVAGSTFVNILRDSTTLISQSAGSTMDTNNAWGTGGGANWTGADRVRNNPSLVYLDSPSTTSATVYKMQFLVDSSTGYINRWGLSAALGGVSTLCLMEVAA